VTKGVFRPCLLLFVLLAGLLPAQVTYDRILHADREPQNWLTYGGGYASQRYSLLTDLTRGNVKDLELKWVYHPKYLDKDGGHAAGGGWRFVHRAEQ
jgi:hypothetical protein